MKLHRMRCWLALVALGMAFPGIGVRAQEGVEETEELPDAEPYRMSMRNPSNRMSLPAYDITKTYDSMVRKSSSAGNRMGDEYVSKGSISRFDQGYSDSDITRDDYAYDPYGSESGYGGGGGGGGYGGYASESGYGSGLSCASGYVNASAVALLAFLFLLNIVQDIVEQIQTGRRKREVEGSENDVFAFVHNGGLSALKEGLPEVVLPLMVDLMEATEAPHCLQRPLCEANQRLSENYGVVGKVVASLLSNVVSKAFSGDDAKRFHLALQASSIGRSEGNCAARFRSCGGISYRQDHDANINNNGGQSQQSNRSPENGDEVSQKRPQLLNHNHTD